MYQHLSVTLNPLVELHICIRCIIDTDLMADNERRLRNTRNDQVPQLPVVRLDVALSRSQRKSLRITVSSASTSSSDYT